ncbi:MULTISPECIES: hypothetical protein [Pseudonocardia]|uniref:Uncharacterized protein n=1 Tax=Pseudonocardia saturnea TaxID=33909 RepID=A0ABQ0S9U6_9PSEU|nr:MULTISPECIES: hypothetical protein [Pseudonocardia]BBF99425.1 hypothetical protein Pdca_06350 [Pseudonocardia autotrophica]GEC29636.1 hypothetical protein PSA01_66650 [Pseudonocardia saturnea]
MTTPDAPGVGTGPVPTEQSDTPVDESPDGDGVHLAEQPVEPDGTRPAAS